MSVKNDSGEKKQNGGVVNLPKDFGKSLIFQCLLIVAEIVHDKPFCWSVIAAVCAHRNCHCYGITTSP